MLDRLVVDASVAAKWYLKSEHSADVADQILESCLQGRLELHAPQLFIYEMCNVFARACDPKYWPDGRARIKREEAIASYRHLLRLPIRYHNPAPELMLRTLELSADSSKRAKDVSYLCLADSLDFGWVTADLSVAKNLPTNAPAHRIVILSTLG